MCLRSIHVQEYENLTAIVLDNGASLPSKRCEEIVSSIGDNRLVYKGNISNLGSQVNFRQALRLAKNSEYFCIFPADVCLTERSITNMVESMLSDNEISICYGRTAIRHIKDQNEDNKSEAILDWPHTKGGPRQANELIELFYSAHNIQSEWSHFSFIGALIESCLLDAVDDLKCPYYDHGAEILVSLSLLIHSKRVFLMDSVTLVHTIGAKRYDTAVRPTNGYTRIEPIHAEDYFLDKYEMLLQRRGISMAQLRIRLLRKAAYTQFRYGMINAILMRIAFKNCVHALIELTLVPLDKIIRLIHAHTKTR